MIDRKALTGQAAPRSTTHLHQGAFIPIRDEMTDSLLFYYDPIRDIIQIKHRNNRLPITVDLRQYKEGDEAEAGK